MRRRLPRSSPRFGCGTWASLLTTRNCLGSRSVRRGDARPIVRKRAAQKLPVAFSFAHLELFQGFDALQQSIQVTTIPTKAAGGWRCLILEDCFVFLGFCLKGLDQVVEILRHGVLRCPPGNASRSVRFRPGSDEPVADTALGMIRVGNGAIGPADTATSVRVNAATSHYQPIMLVAPFLSLSARAFGPYATQFFIA